MAETPGIVKHFTTRLLTHLDECFTHYLVRLISVKMLNDSLNPDEFAPKITTAIPESEPNIRPSKFENK